MADMTAQQVSRPLSASHFRKQTRVPASSLPGAARLGTRLAESCASALGHFGSASWRVALDAIDDVAGTASDMDSVRFRYQSAAGLLDADISFDRPVLASLVEMALGGTGAEEPFEFPDRPLSRIERETQKLAMARLADDLERSFSAAFDRAFTKEGPLEIDEAAAGTSERVVFRFIANVFSSSGEIRIGFLRDGLMSCLGSLDGASARSGAAEGPLQREINKAETILTVTLGPEVLLVEDLAALRPGHHLKLASKASAPVTVWCDGTKMLEASLARSGDKLAVSVIGPAH